MRENSFSDSNAAVASGKRTNHAESYLLSVIRGRPGILPSLLRLLLACLAPLYVIGLETYLLPYNIGLRKRRRLDCPVICIGNLTTGGTGKTPMTQTVCRILTSSGLRPVVLSRGYGGENEYGSAIVSDTQSVLLTSAQAGDEAFLLASTLPGVPVLVGKDRRITGELAIKQFQPDVIVLDDGMQFWQLYRDLDVVLLNAAQPFDNGYTFPRGLLREPKSHLRRAGIIVITGTDGVEEQNLQDTMNRVRKISPETPAFRANLVPAGLRDLQGGVEYTIVWLKAKIVASVCGIGNPASFESMLDRISAGVKPRIRFRDHEAIGDAELENVYQQAVRAGVDALVTTEKDAVRVDFAGCPVTAVALQVSMQIDNEPQFAQAIVSVSRAASPGSR